MKANKFFLGLALIGAILTGCEKDPENNGGDVNAYVSVQLSMASSAGSRAAADGGFDNGSDNEQKIFPGKSIFLFYDAAGNWITSGELQSSTISATGACNVNELASGAYIVLSGPNQSFSNVAQVLTVVNYSNINSLKQLTLAQALEQVAIDATGEDLADANANVAADINGFLMTTSVYYDNDDNLVNTTAITGDNIKTTKAAAEGAPVEIHIERAAAKAELTLVKNEILTLDKDKAGIVVDGELKGVTLTIDGWTLNNVHPTTYLVKRLQSDWLDATKQPFANWNVVQFRRSYWAEGHNWLATDNTGNYIYTYNQADAANEAVAGDYAYCYENTVKVHNIDTANTGTPKPNVNTVLIAAHFVLEGETIAEDLFRYNGIFYTKDNYVNLILKQIKDEGYKKEVATDMYSDLEASDLTIGTNGTLDGITFTLTNTTTTKYFKYTAPDTYTPVANPVTEIQDWVNGLAYVTAVKGYKDGKCYYQIPVEHLGTTFAQYGMVRNHSYKIEVKAINRIGEAVYNPEIQIPTIPAQTTENYLAAEIHILDWHVVTQDVEL